MQEDPDAEEDNTRMDFKELYLKNKEFDRFCSCTCETAGCIIGNGSDLLTYIYTNTLSPWCQKKILPLNKYVRHVEGKINTVNTK